jgi:hypothetical protein
MVSPVIRASSSTVVWATALVTLSPSCTPREDKSAAAADVTPIDSQASGSHDTVCTRDKLDGIERDPACSVRCSDTADVRSLRTSLEAPNPSTIPGGATALLARITNVGEDAVFVCLRGEATDAKGWDRVHGIALAHPSDDPCSDVHLAFAKRTLDARRVDVDQFKPGSPLPCSRTYRVLVRAGRSLTMAIPWAAFALPAPPSPVEDDAGHRFYPKTAPRPLSPGRYKVEVTIPFVEAVAELRIVSATIDVQAE